MDHAHEQLNKMIKGQGSAIGLTENPSALHRWMIAGPEIAQTIISFEGTPDQSDHYNHHEENAATQNAYFSDVKSLIEVLKEYGNPFMEDNGELYSIDKKGFQSQEAIDRMNNMYQIEKLEYLRYVAERLDSDQKGINDSKKKRKKHIFDEQVTTKYQINHNKRLPILKMTVPFYHRCISAARFEKETLKTFSDMKI